MHVVAPQQRPRRPAGGFTLVEVLLAMTLGALLLVGAAAVTGMFSDAVAALSEDVASDHEAALARITRDVRYAYTVEVPSASELHLQSEAGPVAYQLVDDELVVTTPAGDEGVLCDEVAALSFTAQTMRRLREGPLESASGTLYSRAAPPTTKRALELPENARLAIGFILDSDAGPGSVSDIHEQLVAASPTTLHLPLAGGSTTGHVRLEVFPARAPGDPRPRSGAAALGSVTLPVPALPLAVLDPVWVALESLGLGGDDDDDGPLANLLISIKYSAPTATVPIDVASAFGNLQGGVAYSLVLTVLDPGGVTVLSGHANGSSPANVAYAAEPGDAFEHKSLVVAFTLGGHASTTSTVATDAVALVRTALRNAAGESWVRSASVYSQVVADDPWLGTLPGEDTPGP